MKKALIMRLGGLGDLVILGCVAKELKRQGYEVHGCLGSPTVDPEKLFMGTDLFDKYFKYGKSFQGLDVYETEDGVASIQLLKKDYDLVVDYRFSVEMNSLYRHLANGQGKEWYASQNSNYQNWQDIMFSWAGIDPTKIADEDKRPIYIVTEEESKWAEKVLKRAGNFVVAIQTNASSLVRTWYHPSRLAPALREAFPKKDMDFLIFDGGNWIHKKGNYELPIIIPKGIDPIRASAALLAGSDLFISADSGFSHIAEALCIKSVTIYTTVPAWTRIKYYKYSKAVEPMGDVFDGVHCRPCFILDRFCPRVKEDALKQLTPRENRIKEAAEQQMNPTELAKELNTTPQGVMMEHEMLQKRMMALFERQAPCTMTITPERIIQAVKEIL